MMELAIRMSFTAQVIGDYFLFMGEIILLFNIHRKKSCTGISLKSQILLAIAFTIRYVDLAILYLKTYERYTNQSFEIIMVYNAIKVAHIFVIYWAILIVFLYFNSREDRKFDTFRNEILISACVILSVLYNYNLQLAKILRTFSFCLEAVATLPQTYLISKANHLDTVVIYYIGSLTLYKSSHIIYWICSLFYFNSHSIEHIGLYAGIIQLIIYLKFFISNVILCKLRSIYSKNNNQQDERLSRVKVVQSKDRRNYYKINESNV